MPQHSDLRGPAPAIWLLTDNKPGHRNQLKGLGNRLRVLTGASLHWLEAPALKIPLWRTLLGLPPAMDSSLPRPTLIIAAGAGTHRLLLSLRRLRGSRTVVLMKPSFPLHLVNAAIIPEHDHVRADQHTLITKGSLNAVTPITRLTEKPEGLVLVGGPSRHFEWDNAAVFDQILHLMTNHPQWRWTISSSRRTPDELVTRLATLEGPKVTVVTPSDTDNDWLGHQLTASRAAWVTPDSSSMVYEALTSGIPTGVFELAPKNHSRIAAGVQQLAEQGLVGLWSDQASVMQRDIQRSPGLWEADRAARWLLATQAPQTKRRKNR